MPASEGSMFAQLLACIMKGVFFSQHKAFCCPRHPPSFPMQWSTVELAKGASSEHVCEVVQLLSALVRAAHCTWHQPPRPEVLRRRQNISGKGILFSASPSDKNDSSFFPEVSVAALLSVVQSLLPLHEAPVAAPTGTV